MGGLEVKDRMSDNGTLHTRVLRVVLRSHLLTLRPMLEQTISETFEDEYASGKILGDGWRSIHSFSMAKNLIRTVNSFVYFGKHLSSDHGFLEAAMQYPDDVFYTSEVLRFLPSFLAPIAAPILMRQGRAAKTLIRYLHSVIEERLMNQSSANPQTKSLDCIQWIIDTNSRKNNWSTERVIQVVIGLWYASVHQLAISVVYGLVDLCEHAEYLEPLREEVEKHRHLDYVDEDLERMPRLDSFLKESARLHPSDSISIRRKAVQPYVFRDGTHVTAGDVVCVPLRAIMCDEKNFPNAMTFDGFRFMTEDGTGVTSKLTDESARFPLWGLGRRSW
jgi:cytochrome P450